MADPVSTRMPCRPRESAWPGCATGSRASAAAWSCARRMPARGLPCRSGRRTLNRYDATDPPGGDRRSSPVQGGCDPQPRRSRRLRGGRRGQHHRRRGAARPADLARHRAARHFDARRRAQRDRPLSHRPSQKIVLLTVSEGSEDLAAALNSGAQGYVLKGVGSPTLAEILKSVAAGERYVPPTLSARLLSALSDASQASPLAISARV